MNHQFWKSINCLKPFAKQKPIICWFQPHNMLFFVLLCFIVNWILLGFGPFVTKHNQFDDVIMGIENLIWAFKYTTFLTFHRQNNELYNFKERLTDSLLMKIIAAALCHISVSDSLFGVFSYSNMITHIFNAAAMVFKNRNIFSFLKAWTIYIVLWHFAVKEPWLLSTISILHPQQSVEIQSSRAMKQCSHEKCDLFKRCKRDPSHAPITKVTQPYTHLRLKVTTSHLFFWACWRAFWEMKENTNRNICHKKRLECIKHDTDDIQEYFSMIFCMYSTYRER